MIAKNKLLTYIRTYLLTRKAGAQPQHPRLPVTTNIMYSFHTVLASMVHVAYTDRHYDVGVCHVFGFSPVQHQLTGV